LHWAERLKVGGVLEGQFRWVADGPEAQNASELYIRRLELSLQAALTDELGASVLFNSEYLGLEGADASLQVDEAFLEFSKGPFYLVLGKRTLPFGLFESHLITDPMVQDGYESKDVGLTAGLRKGPVEASLTIYEGQVQMEHLFESGLFDTSGLSRVLADGEAELSSFVLSARWWALPERLLFFVGFLSEPGAAGRNSSLNGGLSAAFGPLRADAEAVLALGRERYQGLQEAFREAALSLSLAYEFVLRERTQVGGGLFAARRAHLVAEPLEVALRWEHFWDDGLAEATGGWSVRDRFSLGGRYAFYYHRESGLMSYVAAEYRVSTYRGAPEAQELYLALGASF
jgi:hypothetical protein